LLLIFIIGFTSCSEKSTPETETNLKVEESEASIMYREFGQNFSDVIAKEVPAFNDSTLISIYANRNSSYWIGADMLLTKDADSLVNYLKNAEQFGLFPHKYWNVSLNELYQNYISTPSKDQAYKIELSLTEAYLKLAKDLHYGLIENKKLFTKLNLKTDTLDYVQLFADSTALITNLLNTQPTNGEYVLLQKSLANFIKTNTLNDEIIRIPNFRKDSVSAYLKAKEVLVKLNYCTLETADSNLVNAVKQFQKDNGLTPDGLIGKYTASMLETSSWDKYKQAAINLEKWRWIENWGDHYFFANIPEYLIKIYKNNLLVKENRTVVGTVANTTPELDSKLEYFIVNPEWHVPYSITTKELIPKMKKDPTYLARNGYSIKGGTSISSIDWENATPSNFSYSIKQKSGKYNALGRVKFIFKNKHSVYFHDTPSKSFFKRDIRSYSHGCIRVQNPFEIAQYIVDIEQDSIWMTGLDSIKKTMRTKSYTPKEKYEVHVGYFTSTGDTLGNLRTYMDVYTKNDSLLNWYQAMWESYDSK